MAFLLAGIGILGWYGSRLAAWQQTLLWGFLFLTLALLLRRGWLKLFGPVLFYDLVRTARRRQYVVLRCLYAVFLLAMLFSIYWIYIDPDDLLTFLAAPTLSSSKMADFTAAFSYSFLGVQFLVAFLLTPAYTAGAIAEEKERHTFDFLLATDLHNREIVLSIMASRLANLALVLLTGLPILGLLQFLGGIDPNLLLAGFAGTGLTMASLASLGLCHSIYARKPRDAIMRTYFGACLYLALSGLSWLLLLPALGWADFPSTDYWTSPVTVQVLVEWFSAGNAVAVAIQLKQGVVAGTPLDALLPAALRNYAWFHGLIAVGCSAWAVTCLRGGALGPSAAPRRKTKTNYVIRRRRRRRRTWLLTTWPMLWKELFAEPGPRRGLLSRIGIGVLVVGSFLPVAGIVYWHFFQPPRGGGMVLWGIWYGYGMSDQMNFWVSVIGTVVACLILLQVAVRAAGSISGERDRQTLDGLLITPLDSNAILFAKWLGSILSSRWAWLWLGMIWSFGLFTGGLDPLAVPWLLLAWLVFAAFLAGLGMWFSVISRTTQRATLWTVLTTLGVTGGHWLLWMCCVPLAHWLAGTGNVLPDWPWVLEAYAFTPPLTLSLLAFSRVDQWDYTHHELKLAAAWFGLILWALAAVVLWMLASARFRKAIGRAALLRPERADPDKVLSERRP